MPLLLELGSDVIYLSFSPLENCNRNISAAEKVCHCFLFLLLFVCCCCLANRHQMKGGPASAICLSLEFLLQGRKPKEFRSLFLSLAFSISISAGWLVHIKNVSTNSQKNFPKCSERESHWLPFDPNKIRKK